MPEAMTSEIHRRILSLRAELDALSSQLISQKRDVFERDAASGQGGADGAEAANVTEEASPLDHRRSLRTLRDLLWQGRWGLAYHLARALEAQGVAMSDFPPETIRAWALVARAERRSSQEARSLSQNLSTHGLPSGAAPLARRIFDWATLIGLLRSVNPQEVRSCAAGFSPPEELPETAAWWQEYVETLASALRPATRWTQLPEHREVSTEIDALMIRDNTEPVRLAASCLMMSVRNAMRHVQVVASENERYILNSELARVAALQFDQDGSLVTCAADVERAICDLTPETARGRLTVVSEAGPLANEEQVVAKHELERQVVELSASAPTPRAQLTLSRLEAVEESLHSAVEEEAGAALPIEDAQREARRAAARTRLQRYSERLAARNNDPALVALPFRAVVSEDGSSMSPPEILAGLVAAPTTAMADKVPAAGSRTSGGRTVPVPVDSHSGSVQRRDIHASSLASAFGVEGSSNLARLAPTSHRAQERDSLWGMFFNPQAAIVAGLLVIAGAVVAGLGTGLRARTVVETTANAENASNNEPVEFTGDLPQVE